MKNKKRKIAESFFKNVMAQLGYYEWNIQFCSDSYCWVKQKKITVDENYPGDIRQIILHEIAHINTAKYCNQKHNLDFWKRLSYLTRKFLKNDLDQEQKNHREYFSIGFYNLSYKNQ